MLIFVVHEQVPGRAGIVRVFETFAEALASAQTLALARNLSPDQEERIGSKAMSWSSGRNVVVLEQRWNMGTKLPAFAVDSMLGGKRDLSLHQTQERALAEAESIAIDNDLDRTFHNEWRRSKPAGRVTILRTMP